MYPIERDIELPMGRTRYPFAEMNVGDSFLVQTRKKGHSARIASIRFVKVHQPTWEFSLRRVEGGWRLWRTK